MQDQNQGRCVHFAIGDRERFEIAPLDMNIVEGSQPRARSSKHRIGTVDTDQPGNEGCQRLGNESGAATEVGDDRVVGDQAEQAKKKEAGTEQLLAEPIPTCRTRIEKLLPFITERPTVSILSMDTVCDNADHS